jgi:hypothetical protein
VLVRGLQRPEGEIPLAPKSVRLGEAVIGHVRYTLGWGVLKALKLSTSPATRPDPSSSITWAFPWSWLLARLGCTMVARLRALLTQALVFYVVFLLGYNGQV